MQAEVRDAARAAAGQRDRAAREAVRKELNAAAAHAKHAMEMAAQDAQRDASLSKER